MKIRHILSIILTISILICTGASPAFAAGSNAEDSGERATLIVTLDTPCLLDIVNDSGGKYKNVRDLITSDKGKTFTDRMIASQDSVIAELGSRIRTADFTESRRYTAVTNAFTVNALLSDIPVIKSLGGVKSVSVSANRQAPETENGASENAAEDSLSETEAKTRDYETIGLNYKNDVNAVSAYEEGYTGKGMLIAVIDNEFDVHHDAFSGAPKEIKYDKEYVRQIAASSMLGISAKYSINDIFYNGKIIYAYDYAENDNKCYSSKCISHGTHVAGIAAGNNKNRGILNFKGMAYDAQLALFKIGKNDNTLPDEAIVAALDDAVKLGPDVINCSYGSTEYLIQDYEGKQLYNKLMQSGTAIIAAAGNDAYNGYALGLKEIPTSYVNYGTICNPSAMSGSLSVASSVPKSNYGNKLFFVFNGSDKAVDVNTVYSDLTFDEVYPELKSAGAKELPDGTEIDTAEYIYLDCSGAKSELAKYDLTDKIVIINESESTLDELIKNSVDTQCYAIVVIRKKKDSKFAKISPERDFFVYSIDNSNAEYLRKHPEGRISIMSYSGYVTVNSEDPLTVSDFSSMGTLADLTLKPDITTPGTDIISSVRNGSYEKMSGTSMATPMMTGAYAVVKQFVRETGETELLSPQLEQEYIYSLLMSTASPLLYKVGKKETPYSPRAQGAGLLDVYSAVSTGAYLSYNGKRPSVSLKEIKDGKFSFEFTLTNKSYKDLTFTPGAVITTDAYRKKTNKKTGSFKYLNTLRPEDITDKAVISFTADGRPCDTVEVQHDSDVVIGVTVELDGKFVSDRSIIFSNGFFADGYITLECDDNPALSIPFSGFCGDWSKGRVFPSNMYYSEGSRNVGFPSARSTLYIASTFNYSSYFTETAGKNVFGYNNLPYQISFGKNSLRSYLEIPDDVASAFSMLIPSVYVMRDTYDFTVSIFNMDSDLLYCENFGEISSYFGFSDGPYEQFVTEQNREKLERYSEFVSTLREGTYRYMLTATTVGADGDPDRTESTAFTVAVDNTVPQIDDYHLKKTDDGKLYLYVNAKDNQFIQGIRLSAVQHDDNGEVTAKINMYEDMLSFWGSNENFVEYLYDPSTRLFCFRYDLTDFGKFIDGRINAKEQVYTDDDMTIIFQNENDYSNSDRDHIYIEAVDDAYNCSKGQEINVNSYGEAMLKFVDEDGRPVEGVSIIAPDCTRASNEDGLLPLRNLPLGKNSYRLICDYTLADGSRFAEFELTEDDFTTEKVYTVKKLEGDSKASQGDSKSGSDEKKTYVINFPTGDDSPSAAVFAVLMSLCAAGFVLLSRKRYFR